jgi:hypothetical protein
VLLGPLNLIYRWRKIRTLKALPDKKANTAQG